jgi:hypothetical protein
MRMFSGSPYPGYELIVHTYRPYRQARLGYLIPYGHLVGGSQLWIAGALQTATTNGIINCVL